MPITYALKLWNFAGLSSREMLRSFGDRSFAAAAPALLNALPLAIWKSRSLQHFKSSLKTCLLKLTFDH